MKNYAVLNASNEVVNVIVWDEESEWSPPDDHSIIKSEIASIGDVWDDDRQKFIRPSGEDI